MSRISFWNVSTGKEIQSIDGNWEHGVPLSISRDGRMLAVPNPDGAVSLWELATKKERLRVPPPEPASRQRGSPFVFSPNGRLLLMGEGSNRLLVAETATGKELPPVIVQDGPLDSIGFSPDGKIVAALGKDGTILLWDAARLIQRPAAAAGKLSARELDSLWVDLAGKDAARAWKAIVALASAPESAVPFLNERLTPAPPPDGQRITRMIADLDSINFPERAKATHDLEALGDVAEPALRQALRTNAPLESRRRIDTMLAKVEAQILPADMVRGSRAVEALEYVGAAEARQVLTRLAKGARAALLTREAQASLQRLAERAIAAP